MRNLTINSDSSYLELQDLPYNCIFNKVITGCGGTTIVLFNNENYVIAVPTTELITNKTGLIEAGSTTIISPIGKEQKVFGLFGIFTYNAKKALKEYLKQDGVKKVICTYDKLPKLIEYLNPSDYRLLVDEYHILLKAYSYRYEAIDGVLNSFNSYKSYCFMSATPIDTEFKPKALEGVEEIKADWGLNTDRLFVRLERTNNPYVKAANIINAYKRDGYIEVDGKKSYEAYFFINSVTDIASILQYCNLTKEEVKIVCADNEQNREKLAGYQISNSRAANKPFTFITSKSFEGADYYSESGLCFVVSNSSNKNTLLDISTDIYQIAGRIRTKSNPFRNILIHIFNTSGRRNMDLDITYSDMVKRVEEEIEGAEEILKLINTNPKVKGISDKLLNKEYVVKDSDGRYKVNDMVIKLDLFTFRLEQSIYKDGISIAKGYKDNGVDTSEGVFERINEHLTKAAKKLSFKDAFLKYIELKRNIFNLEDASELIKVQPLIVDAYNKLGAEKVRSLRYSKKDIEDALINSNPDTSKEYKAAQMLYKRLPIGFYNTQTLKKAISDIYGAIGMEVKPKTSEIEKYFNCKSTNKKIDGKTNRGYELYSPKIIFK